MFNKDKSLEMLEGFQNHYNYDTSYMKEMLKNAPEAYQTFEAFLPMANFVKEIPLDVLYVAKVTAMKNEDCAACLQLNVDMALEAGINKNIIKEIIYNDGRNLTSELKNIYDFSLIIVQNRNMDEALYDTIISKYSKSVIIELALALASAKIFPTIKRTLNEAESCKLIEIKI